MTQLKSLKYFHHDAPKLSLVELVTFPITSNI